MVGSSKRGGHLQPVENTGRALDIPMERPVSREEREYLRRVRSSAYWFAATKWGMIGLVAGIILGGVGMYFASTATLDLAQDAVTKGAIVERLRQEQDRQDGIQPVPVNPAAP
jgi:hypothetical protein